MTTNENEPPFKKTKTGHGAGNVNTEKVIEDIYRCLDEINKINRKAGMKILQIEQKYNRLRKPYFQLRNEHFKKLPNFWGISLSNHPQIGTIIQPEEEDCLNYITDCIAEEFDVLQNGYEISFYFKENPYFENEVIVKTFYDTSSSRARSESTPIKWKQGKNLLHKYGRLILNQERKGSRSIVSATFFSWFLDTKNPWDDPVADVIKDKWWPSAFKYYIMGVNKTKSNQPEETKEIVDLCSDDAAESDKEDDEEDAEESDQVDEHEDNNEGLVVFTEDDRRTFAELVAKLPDSEEEELENSDIESDQEDCDGEEKDTSYEEDSKIEESEEQRTKNNELDESEAEGKVTTSYKGGEKTENNELDESEGEGEVTTSCAEDNKKKNNKLLKNGITQNGHPKK